MHRRFRLVVVAVAVGVVAPLLATVGSPADTMPSTVEKAHQCSPKDRREPGLQGDVPKAEQDANRAYGGYNCGLALIGRTALDADGRTPTGNGNMAWAGKCAYVAGSGALFGEPDVQPGDGVAVVDVSKPRRPRHVRTLRTPGAAATLETLHAAEHNGRAILVVGQYGNDHWPTNPKPMDVYDVSNCAEPRLLETFYFPENIHNLTVSGNARYVFSTAPIQVVDLDPLFDDDPQTMSKLLGNLDNAIPGLTVSPGPVGDFDDAVTESVPTKNEYISHEAWPTADGRKLYIGGQLPMWETFTIVDIGAWLDGAGAPQVISQRYGRGHSVRTATIGGRRYALHSEESVFFAPYGCVPEELNPVSGASEPWLTDITDEADPSRVVQFGLEINKPENCPAQMESEVSGSVHYHDVDDETNTTFVMASMWNSGVRIFDVRDPKKPTEVAYFNPADIDPGPETTLDHAWAHIRYVPETGHIWFSTASGGFWVVEIERKLRRYLGLDKNRKPPLTRYPRGRPGTLGSGISTSSTLAVNAAQYYCTLGTAQGIATRSRV